jgi:hypothetical protein
MEWLLFLSDSMTEQKKQAYCSSGQLKRASANGE